MLYVKLNAEKAIAEWLHKEKKSLQDSKMPLHPGNSTSERFYLDSEKTSSLQSIKDSKWLTLSAQEQLAWVKNTQDPRIARGLRSPLEKKILSLDGIHSSTAQRLLARRSRKENENIYKLKSASLDYRLSQAMAYYSKRHDEILEDSLRYVPVELSGPEKGSGVLQEEKKWTPQKWDYLVNERELKQIERHIYRANQARNLRNKTCILYPHDISRKTFPPRIWTTESKKDDIQKRRKTREQMRKSEAKQIEDHQKRMILGRKVMQSHREQRFYSIPSVFPRVSKPEMKKEQIKFYEWVAAYPLLQPRHGKRLEIHILIEKSKLKGEKQEESRMKQSTGSIFLEIPPFLKSRVDKMKVY
ncbi:uncharacterized protein LOC141558486 [Sminthopsis crassicaudata]|uniref:uncharacterized protein LOC141558486 n=1 Tax=Sminthopsis crassicaudata TaxID=9301 RepID=UPI003D681BA8